jgi:hypothetical protein
VWGPSFLESSNLFPPPSNIQVSCAFLLAWYSFGHILGIVGILLFLITLLLLLFVSFLVVVDDIVVSRYIFVCALLRRTVLPRVTMIPFLKEKIKPLDFLWTGIVASWRRVDHRLGVAHLFPFRHFSVSAL